MGGADSFLIPLSQEEIQVQYFHNPSSSALLDIFSLHSNAPISRTTFPLCWIPSLFAQVTMESKQHSQPCLHMLEIDLMAIAGDTFSGGITWEFCLDAQRQQNYSAALVILPRWHWEGLWGVSAGERDFLPKQK